MVVHRETVAYGSPSPNPLACASYIGLVLGKRNVLSPNHGQGSGQEEGKVAATVTKPLQRPTHCAKHFNHTLSSSIRPVRWQLVLFLFYWRALEIIKVCLWSCW